VQISSHAADAVVLATGGYGNAFFLSTNAKGCNVTATWRAYKRGAFFANPCYTQIHPPASRSAASTSQSSPSCPNRSVTMVVSGCPSAKRLRQTGRFHSGRRAGLFPGKKVSQLRNLAPRDISSRAAKEACDQGRGVGPGGLGVYLDFADSIKRLGENIVRERYGNLFDMYEKITGENAYKVPMRIYPAVHYTMGRHVGGLQPHDHPPGFVCARGG
jgi:succinate dehydrogenase / fumarate reductase flavoprotein subunit